MIMSSFFAFMSTLAFGIMFNIRGKKLVIASLGGAITWFSYSIFTNLQSAEVTSLFAASVCGAVFSEIMARVIKTPVTTFIICAIIPLVPGSGMYYTMLEVIRGNTNKSLNLGFETLIKAGAIALGIIFVSTIAKILINLKKNKSSAN